MIATIKLSLMDKFTLSFRILSFVFIFFLFSQESIQADEVIKAVTEDGRNVALFSDGTWVFKPGKNAEKKPEKKSRFSFLKGKQKSANTGKVPLEGGKGAYFIYYDDQKWHVKKPPSGDDAEYTFTHKEGDGYAMMIFERISIPLPNLKNIALENARSVAPDAKIVTEDMITVNGYEVMKLVMQGTIEGIPFTYYGYYASGSWGTLQFISYTSSPLFAEYKKDFTELLNGLNISND